MNLRLDQNGKAYYVIEANRSLEIRRGEDFPPSQPSERGWHMKLFSSESSTSASAGDQTGLTS